MRILRKYLCVDMWDGGRKNPWKRKTMKPSTSILFVKHIWWVSEKCLTPRREASRIAPPEHQTSWHPFLPRSHPELCLCKAWAGLRGEGRGSYSHFSGLLSCFIRCARVLQERGIKRSLEIRNWMILSVIEVSRELSYTLLDPSSQLVIWVILWSNPNESYSDQIQMLSVSLRQLADFTSADDTKMIILWVQRCEICWEALPT